LFIGFAGDLVVGVWVGRDDNKSLGKITGGTAPARIWRSFMVPALAIDRRAGPALPRTFRVPQAPQAPQPPTRRKEKQSPLPEDWSERTRGLRELVEQLEEIVGDAGGR
jgi:penicillin-binding protein 1A